MAIAGKVDASGAPGDIVIPGGALRPPRATSEFSFDMNLDSSKSAASFSAPVSVVDSLGNKLVMSVNFTKDPANPQQWSYQITVPGDAIAGGTPGTTTPLLATPGTLTFGSDGTLASANPVSPIPIAVANLADGAADLAINWNLNRADGTPRITLYSQASSIAAIEQDGNQAASLTGMGMADGGMVMAKYSDGSYEVVAQLAVAAIRNPDSLVAAGDNNFQIGPGTADPAIGAADSGGRGKIVAGALESSTVDIATEFTNLIVYQRAYQANARVVTTTDQLTQDTISLKNS
jgi:flagellar hook protein FlgE